MYGLGCRIVVVTDNFWVFLEFLTFNLHMNPFARLSDAMSVLCGLLSSTSIIVMSATYGRLQF